MDIFSRALGYISQMNFIRQIGEKHPALARMVDRTLWVVILGAIGIGINHFASLDGEWSALISTVLYMWQTRASKQYRDLYPEENA